MKIPNSWALRYSVASVAGIVALVAIAWVVFGFHSLGLDTKATIAVILGVVGTIGLAVGLMALTFYSDRSGRDQMIGGDRRSR
jgi:asparagine N-glycosylation enzyme membrane subunit Stt3